MRADSVPAQNPVFNVAQAVYTFTPFTGNTVRGVSNSSYAVCYITHAEISTVTRADKGVACRGEELLCTAVIADEGTLPVTNVYFASAIPAGTVFVPGSVAIDGAAVPAVNPAPGFTIPNSLPGQNVAVSFRVTVH